MLSPETVQLATQDISDPLCRQVEIPARLPLACWCLSVCKQAYLYVSFTNMIPTKAQFDFDSGSLGRIAKGHAGAAGTNDERPVDLGFEARNARAKDRHRDGSKVWQDTLCIMIDFQALPL